MDEGTLALLTRLAPELIDQIISRAMVLERVSVLQPVGRRALAQRLHMPERETRMITDAMRGYGLLETSSAGMMLTDKGYQLLDGVRDMVRSRLGIASLEAQLQRLLKVDRVLIASGNADEDPEVFNEVCRMAASRLRQTLSDGMILAITGGTTIAGVARCIPRGASINVKVIPARGGLGSSVETQASTLAEEIAHHLGGKHRALYLPDTLGQDALRELLKLQEIREPLDEIKRADVILYGVARADDMATNRLASPENIDHLLKLGARAEVLGYCFDRQGRVIEAMSSLGIPIEAIAKIPTIIAVACGARKAEAILAVTRHHKHDYLIMDESAARAITEIIRRE